MGDDVLGIVSVHGGLMPFEVNTDVVSPRVLVLSGGDDDSYTDVSFLEDTLDNAGNTYEITRYSGVEHGFTEFDTDVYNEVADHRVWESTTSFLSEVFGEVKDVEDITPNVIPIDYEDTEGNETISLRGYLALPDDTWIRPLPLVVIMPNWDGVNTYEQTRATMLAELGYITFAADIFGADLQEDLDMETKIELVTKYFNDLPLYIHRMQLAIDTIASEPSSYSISTDNIAIIGYCFGGSGVVQYGLHTENDNGVKVAVSFHGNFFKETAPEVNNDIYPRILILSGGDDPQHGNQTLLEQALNDGNATWEITSYSNAEHGFTLFDSPAYDPIADARSWNSMKSAFEEVLIVPQQKNADADDNDGIPNSSYSNGYYGFALSSFILIFVAFFSML